MQYAQREAGNAGGTAVRVVGGAPVAAVNASYSLWITVLSCVLECIFLCPTERQMLESQRDISQSQTFLRGDLPSVQPVPGIRPVDLKE